MMTFRHKQALMTFMSGYPITGTRPKSNNEKPD